jgi:hypothetical protein
MATRGGTGRGNAGWGSATGRGSATQRRQQPEQHSTNNAKLDEIEERVTKIEASVASIYSKDDIKGLVKELLQQEVSKLKREVQQQLTNHSAPGSQLTGQMAGYRTADELKEDKRLPLLVNG